MAQGMAQARLRVIEKLEAQPDLTVILDSTGNPGTRLPARFLGLLGGNNGEVMKIQLGAAIGQGILISIAGQVDTGTGVAPVLGKYRVRASRIAGIGKYHAELMMESAPPEFLRDEEADSTRAERPVDFRIDPEDCDYYEALQVSRNADTDTIHRVFHVLAQRYHPDNRETGDDDRFRLVVEAHAVLSNHERRASYDVRLASRDKARFKLFDSLDSTQGVQAEVRKRKGILRILYTKRLSDPQQPQMRVRELAELLGCPIEHLEFAFWFLRELKMIIRTDNNLFEITGHGVAEFEAEESNYSKKPHLRLPAAQATA